MKSSCNIFQSKILAITTNMQIVARHITWIINCNKYANYCKTYFMDYQLQQIYKESSSFVIAWLHSLQRGELIAYSNFFYFVYLLT